MGGAYEARIAWLKAPLRAGSRRYLISVLLPEWVESAATPVAALDACHFHP
jgi:hypothetical protein